MFMIQSGGKGTLGFLPPSISFALPQFPSQKDLTHCVVNDASKDIKDSSVILVSTRKCTALNR